MKPTLARLGGTAFCALALILSLVASPAAAAKARGTLHVTTTREPRTFRLNTLKDTTRVQEITIDDEGIRIVNQDKQVILPGDHVRITRGMGDTLPMVQIHSGGDNEIVQFFKDVHVEKGQQAGTVVAILGNVRNDGLISGDCVSILGSIVQGDSAVIRGEAVTIGGAVRSAGRDARVEGETVSIGFLPFAGFAVPSVPLLLLFGLFSLLLYVALAALAGRLFPDRLVRIADTVSNRSFLSLVLGLLSIPLAMTLCLLLMVTVIGIPLAFLLPFLFLLAAFFGYTAAVYLLGCKLLGRPTGTSTGMIGPIAAGTAFVTLFYVIGVPMMALEGTWRVFGFGFLLLWLVIGTVCWMMGLGALLLSRLGQDPNAPAKSGSQWAPSAPVPPVPPVPPTPRVSSDPPASPF